MKAHSVRTLLAGSATLLLACGDAAGPAVDRNDPGTGTGTLSVIADVEGRQLVGGMETVMDVELRDAQGAPVSGATVTIDNNTVGTTTLFETGPGTGDYTATINGFAAGDYRLDVVSNTDRVENVVVGGIGVHTIDSPLLADTVTADSSLMVTWSRPAEGFRADVESRDYEAKDILDSGSHVIPATDVRARSDERIRVTRYNEVAIAGGLAGSRLRLRVRRETEPILVQ